MNSQNNYKMLRLKKRMPVIFVYAVMIALAIGINIVNPGFLSMDHLHSTLKQISFLGLVCIGQTLVILTGGIDLSAEYTLLLSNVVAATIISGREENTLTALLVILTIGIVTGLVNGAGVYFLKIPAMIMTLAVGTVLYGVTYIFCNGAPGGHSSVMLANLSKTRILTLFSGVAFIWIIFSVLIIIVLGKTTLGRSIYAIGTNRESAVYSGINVCATTLIVYVIAGLMSAIAGFLLLGYTETSYMSTGAGYNMDSIAAVVIGGTSIMGGFGGYVGTIAGVCIMTLINSLLTILHISEATKQIVQGMLIIVMLIAVYGRKKKR